MANGNIFPFTPPPPGSAVVPPILQEGDPGAVGTGVVWIIPSTGATRARNAANTGWIVISTGGAALSPGVAGDIAAEAIASTVLAGATGKYADAGHRHPMPAAGAPVASARGNTAITGAVGTFADSGHRHAREAISVAVPLVESGAGAAGTSLIASNEDHAHPAGSGSGVTVSENRLTGNVAIAAGVFSDGPSLSLPAGTYLLDAYIEVQVTGAGDWVTAKIMAGATAIAAGESFQSASTAVTQVHMTGSVVLAGTTTVKIQASTLTNAATIFATPNTNATGLTNLASCLRAVKIA